MYAWLCGPSSPVRPPGRMVREECLYRLNDKIVSNNLYSGLSEDSKVRSAIDIIIKQYYGAFKLNLR